MYSLSFGWGSYIWGKNIVLSLLLRVYIPPARKWKANDCTAAEISGERRAILYSIVPSRCGPPHPSGRGSSVVAIGVLILIFLRVSCYHISFLCLQEAAL